MKVQGKEIKRREYEVHITNIELKNIISEYIQKTALELNPGQIRNKYSVQAPMQPALKIYFDTDAYYGTRARVKWKEDIA